MPRFVLLEHTSAPDDPAGRHYDLLLDTGSACRTWRLAALPEPAGPTVAATESAPHQRAWLEHTAGAVSGGRGFARRIDAGTYEPLGTPPGGAGDALEIQFAGTLLRGRLRLVPTGAGWTVGMMPAADPQSPESP